MPEKAFKYWTGVDKYLGQNRPWSFKNLGQYLDDTLQDNPLFRVGNTANHIVYGGLNMLTGAIPHKVFNQWLGMNIECFGPPPQTLREQAAWVTSGVMLAAPLRSPVLKAIGAEARPTLSYSIQKSTNVKTSSLTSPTANYGKIKVVDLTQKNISSPQVVFVDKSVSEAPNYSVPVARSRGGSSQSGNGGLRMVEGTSKTVMVSGPKEKISSEMAPSEAISFDPQNNQLLVTESKIPQECPNGLPDQPMVEPSGMYPEFYLVPGREKAAEQIGDPEDHSISIQDPKREDEREKQTFSPMDRGMAAIQRERTVADNLAKLREFYLEMMRQKAERLQVEEFLLDQVQIPLPQPEIDLVHFVAVFDDQGKIKTIAQQDFDAANSTHYRGGNVFIHFIMYHPPGNSHPILINFPTTTLPGYPEMYPEISRVLTRMWEQTSEEREHILREEPFLLDGTRTPSGQANSRLVIEDLRRLMLQETSPYWQIHVGFYIENDLLRARRKTTDQGIEPGDVILKITRPLTGGPLQMQWEDLSPRANISPAHALPESSLPVIPSILNYLQSKAAKGYVSPANLSAEGIPSPISDIRMDLSTGTSTLETPITTPMDDSTSLQEALPVRRLNLSPQRMEEILQYNKRVLEEAVSQIAIERANHVQVHTGNLEQFIGTLIITPERNSLIKVFLKLNDQGVMQEVLPWNSGLNEGLVEAIAYRGDGHLVYYDPSFHANTEEQRMAMRQLFSSYEEARYNAFLDNPIGLDFIAHDLTSIRREFYFDQFIEELREIAFKAQAPFQEVQVFFYLDHWGQPRAYQSKNPTDIPQNSWGKVRLKVSTRPVEEPSMGLLPTAEKIVDFDRLNVSFPQSAEKQDPLRTGAKQSLDLIRDLSHQDFQRKLDIVKGRQPRPRRSRQEPSLPPPLPLEPQPQPRAVPLPLTSVPPSSLRSATDSSPTTTEVSVEALARMVFPQLGPPQRPGLFRRIFGGGRPKWTDSPNFVWNAQEGEFYFKMPVGAKEVIFGREGDEKIKGDDKVSRRHFKITRLSDPEIGTSYTVTGLDGIVFHNGEPLSPHQTKWLSKGDKIQVTPEIMFIFKPD